MNTLYNLIKWMAETVHTLNYKNDFYDVLIQFDSAKQLLREVGQALVSMFS